MWLAGGVEPADALRYAAYVAGFVLAPGWLLLRAICPSVRGSAWQLALAWPLGLVLEIAFFALTASLDARDLFVAYPLAVGLPCALLLLIRRRRPMRGRAEGRLAPRFSSTQRWSIAGLSLFALAYLGLTLVASSPLPGSVDSVLYPTDQMFHISVAAEAKHHWPLEDPLVSGGSFHYHYFFHLHAAAASQVSGVELPVLIMRLCLPPLVALMVLQLSLAGRAVTGLGWAGPVTAGLGLLAWELDLTISEISPFLGVNDIWLWASPTYVLGLVFLVPLVALLAGVVEGGLARIRAPAGRAGAVALIALLMVGAAGSKVVAVPVLAGGLALYLLWRRLTGRGFDRAAAGLLALALAVFALVYVLVYAGDGQQELRLTLGGIYERMPSLVTLEDTVADSGPWRVAFWAAGVAASTLLHFVPVLVGLLWVLKRARPLSNSQGLLLCVLAAGLPAWLLIASDNADNNYFTAFGIVAALPLAAEGLCGAYADWRRGEAVSSRRAGALLALWFAALIAIALAGWEIALDGAPARAYLITYGALALCLLALAVRAWRAGAGRGAAVALLALAIVSAAAIDPLLDSAPISARRLLDGDKLYEVGAGGLGITPRQVEAARWVRDETDEDAVISVSDQRSPQGAAFAPLRAEFPALAERRSFHEGWAYSRQGERFSEVVAGRVLPYPERARLEELVFERADRRALRKLVEDYGVTYLVIDRGDGRVPRAVYRFGPLAFSNGAVDVIALR